MATSEILENFTYSVAAVQSCLKMNRAKNIRKLSAFSNGNSPRLSALRIITSYWRYTLDMAELGEFLVHVYQKSEYSEADLKASYLLKNGALIVIEEEGVLDIKYSMQRSYDVDRRNVPYLLFEDIKWHRTNASHLQFADFIAELLYFLECTHADRLTQLLFPQNPACVALA
jgi:hypothetical protein